VNPVIMPAVFQVEELALTSMIRKSNPGAYSQTGKKTKDSAKVHGKHKDSEVSPVSFQLILIATMKSLLFALYSLQLFFMNNYFMVEFNLQSLI